MSQGHNHQKNYVHACPNVQKSCILIITSANDITHPDTNKLSWHINQTLSKLSRPPACLSQESMCDKSTSHFEQPSKVLILIYNKQLFLTWDQFHLVYIY